MILYRPVLTAVRRRDVIRETMIELCRRLLHLLTQEIKRGDFFSAGVISVDMDVVADGVRGPQSVNAARDQEIFRCNALEEFLRIIEKLTRLFAHLWVIEDRRVTATQFPGMKERRPIDIRNKIAHCERDALGNIAEIFRRAAGNGTRAACAPQTRSVNAHSEKFGFR